MQKLDLQKVNEYVEKHIDTFHQKRADSLEKLKLADILKRKNPYLFKAKHILLAHDFVQQILDAHLQSQEETLFGDFLEKLAIFVSYELNGGIKSTNLTGIDLEFERAGVYYIVEIKSGPNWGNSSQILKMQQNFATAKAALAPKKVVAINGCCYGKDQQPEKDGYLKLCGQRFWEFLSEDPEFYTHIIEPIGYKAKEKNEAFSKTYGRILNLFTAAFVKDFCSDIGAIDWIKLLEFNSKK